MMKRRSWQVLMIALAVAAGTLGSSPKHLEGLENAMKESSQKIDGLVERLSRVKTTVDEIARALGTEIVEQNRKTTVRIGRPPFEAAKVSEFRGVIDVSITLSPGTWRLSDITDDPQAWSIGPRLPDSGREDAYRDWDWTNVSIRCVAGVEGEGPLGSRTIRDVGCQITPP